MTIPILADSTLAQLELAGKVPPDGWHSRRLYVGEVGARNWLEIAHQAGYPLQRHDAFGLQQSRLDAVMGLAVKTMVSLGPGDALQDVPIIEQLARHATDIAYVPVDISRTLLKCVIRNMQQRARIPGALLCDFEESFEFLRSFLRENVQEPILWSLLGGTVGNFDKGVTNFLSGMKSIMAKDDRLLIDIPLAGPRWCADRDPRFRKAEFSNSFKRFVCCGLTDWRPDLDDHWLQRAVDERIECCATDGGDVERTRTVQILDRQTGKTLLCFRRFDWMSVIRWLADQGFDVHFQHKSIDADEWVFGMGVVLLGLGKQTRM